jgi:hypothetical protein
MIRCSWRWNWHLFWVGIRSDCIISRRIIRLCLRSIDFCIRLRKLSILSLIPILAMLRVWLSIFLNNIWLILIRSIIWSLS